MDRPVAYYGSAVRDLDILNLGQSAMVGLAKLSAATLGINGATVGLAATGNSSLTVTIGPGEIYQVAPLEATAVSELTQNTANTIVKQGILLNASTQSGFTAPGTPGQSINYLIEAQYQDLDAGSTVLNYFNVATWPTGAPFTGPGNNSAAQNTVRQGVVAFQVKAGSAATTGTQTTPSPDSGWLGLYAVTVAYGQTTISSGNISTYGQSGTGWPWTVPTNIPAIPVAFQNSQWVAYPDLGVANAYVIAPQPTVTARVVGGTRFLVKFANANTGGSSINDGLGTVALYLNNGSALGANYITPNQVSEIMWDGTGYQMVPGPAAWAGSAGIDALYVINFIV